MIENLSFEYSPGVPVLKGLNLRLEPGARVAWVAGILQRQHHAARHPLRSGEPSAGHVDLDGLDLRHWSRSELRRHVARVHGDDEIFDGSLFDNVRLGNESVGLAEVREAMAAVGLLRKVQAMKFRARRADLDPRAITLREERRQGCWPRRWLRSCGFLLDATLDGFEPEGDREDPAYLLRALPTLDPCSWSPGIRTSSSDSSVGSPCVPPLGSTSPWELKTAEFQTPQ